MDGQAFKHVAMEQVKNLEAERAAIRARLVLIERKLVAWNVILDEEVKFTPSPRLEPEQRRKVIELVKDLIMASGKTGMLPREIRGELEKAGISTGAQVVSNALSRWKLRDYTIEIDGRHYWKAYLSEEELQKAKPRLRRGSTTRTWEPLTASP